MAILTDQEIEDGINSVVATRKSPITGLGEEAWAYLLKFTAHFEGVPNFIYSNKDLPKVVGPDVTVGVGVSIPNKAAVKGVFNQIAFFVKGSKFTRPATLAQVEADYDKAAGMSRLSNSLNAYYQAMQTEVRPMDALKMLPDKMKAKVSDQLKLIEFQDFGSWPAQARVALSSYCYGISPAGAPKFRKALSVRDFDTAGRESYIDGWSKEKVLAHRKLFWNAARLLEQDRFFKPPAPVPDPPQLTMPKFVWPSPASNPAQTGFQLRLGRADRLPDRFDSDIEIESAAMSSKWPPPIPPDKNPP